MASVVVTAIVMIVTATLTAAVDSTLVADCVRDVGHRSAQRWAHGPGQSTYHLAELVRIRTTVFE